MHDVVVVEIVEVRREVVGVQRKVVGAQRKVVGAPFEHEAVHVSASIPASVVGLLRHLQIAVRTSAPALVLSEFQQTVQRFVVGQYALMVQVVEAPAARNRQLFPHAPHPHIGLALGLDYAVVEALLGAPDLLVGRVRNENFSFLRRSAHPARCVDCIADQRELRLVLADDAGDDAAVVDAHFEHQLFVLALLEVHGFGHDVEGQTEHGERLLLAFADLLQALRELQPRAGHLLLAHSLDFLHVLAHAQPVQPPEEVV